MNSGLNIPLHSPKKRSPMKMLFGAVALGILVVLIWFLWALRPVTSQERAVSVVIEPKGVAATAETLKEADLIRSKVAFLTYTTITGARGELQAGEYTFASNASVAEIVNQLQAGQTTSSEEITVRFIEGWTERQALEELQKKGLAVTDAQLDEAFTALVRAHQEEGKYASIFDGIDATETVSAEGYLYPDTYKFRIDATPEQLLTKMLDNMLGKLSDEDLAATEESPYSFYELLTTASIVEREVATLEDRKVVGGIFLSRLDDKYPLQSDATVNYVTGKKTTTPTFQDTRVQSAYNTYTSPGLPPTPISNPSITAIQGVLHPTRTDYYFFLTTPDNETIFSETYEEHLQNRSKYYD